jgi:nitrogenase-associated protein
MPTMNTVVFYEKPGCKGNARQKALLEAAGFTLDVYSLLATPWTAASLRPFFGARAVPEWFNRTAPAIKRGDLNPDDLSEPEALSAMLADPLLIRRPLIEYGGKKVCGFDNFVQRDVLGLGAPATGFEACQSLAPGERCD